LKGKEVGAIAETVPERAGIEELNAADTNSSLVGLGGACIFLAALPI
jgi:hypothetical protein